MSKLVSENDICDETWFAIGGESLVTEVTDNHWNSASTFTLHKSCHTVSNLLRMYLHQSSAVRFAGYKVPHPTKADIELTVQTASPKPGTAVPDPASAVIFAIDSVLRDIETFDKLWTEVLPKTNAVLSRSTDDGLPAMPRSGAQQQQQQQQARGNYIDDDEVSRF